MKARWLPGVTACGVAHRNGVAGTTVEDMAPHSCLTPRGRSLVDMATISVFLADDSVFVREALRAMLTRHADLEIVGVAEDYDGLVNGADAASPDVVVSDIRMPPSFEREGIEGCKLIRKRRPGTGIVILSQYDDPDYAIALLSEGAAGYAYLLKDRIAEGDQLARAIREVATGGSMLDPIIVGALVNPVRSYGGLSASEDELLEMVAQGKPIKAIAAANHSTPAAVERDVEALFRRLADGVSTGAAGALQRLKQLHSGILARENTARRCRVCCRPASPSVSGDAERRSARPSDST